LPEDNAEADPAVADDAPELVRRLQAMAGREGRPPRETADPAQQAWVQMMRTVPPDQQIAIQNFIDVTNAIWPIATNPGQIITNRDTPIPAFTNSPDALPRPMRSLPHPVRDIIHQVTAVAIQQIGVILDHHNRIPNPDNMAALRQNVVLLLDSLLHTNLLSLGSDVPQHGSTQCTVCFEEYEEGDGIVVLPCHPTHHFHRTCIHVSFFPLVLFLHSSSDFI
jgi:hypothetical protein